MVSVSVWLVQCCFAESLGQFEFCFSWSGGTGTILIDFPEVPSLSLYPFSAQGTGLLQCVCVYIIVRLL